MSWKDSINEQVARYIWKKIDDEELTVEQTKALNDFWANIGPLILNEIEWKLDDFDDESRFQELDNLLEIIKRDGNIDTDDENTQRIVATIEDFKAELIQPVDFEDDELEE